MLGEGTAEKRRMSVPDDNSVEVPPPPGSVDRTRAGVATRAAPHDAQLTINEALTMALENILRADDTNLEPAILSRNDYE
jgi:hypothetical protein